MNMKKTDAQENGYGQDHNENISININTDENMDGNQHLNEPVAEESEIEKLKEQIAELLDEVNISVTKAIFYKTVCADLSDLKSLAEYDLMVFFTPVGIKSLKHNFPNFKQGSTRIAAFGFATANMVKTLGYRLDINAPNIINQSMTGALDTYLKESNKK